ncbi:Reverse transcriptase (RNA-dependent DNA polymerase) [Phytophthora infestans]|uniref:Reverse transcriptase (RNA-dependent DNA polymerase) n=1 Tax=Phytophthora infestans TaxID=4787 RepID=A0A8S9U437_PHYIN|nr:Reverse transcriptase (RNA-dependent DNA polymerase) [Phytophthora infestans]
MNWNNALHRALVNLGFTRSVKDPGLYWIKGEDRMVFVPVYVDDILIIGRNEDVDHFAAKLNECFKIKELGEGNYLLELQISFAPEMHVMFRQTKYVQDMLRTFRMNEAHSYLVSGSRPDLATALRILSKFLKKFGVVHWQAAKRVLRYVKCTSDMGLYYDLNEARKYEKLQIEIYADACFASDPEDLKSVSGFTVLCNGQLISAKSWKQGILAESTCEAELITANEGLHDAIRLEQLVDELGLPRENTKLFCDSSSAVALMKHAGKHRRTKQLRIKDLKIRENVVEREVEISFAATQANVADTMTKPLPAEAFR